MGFTGMSHINESFTHRGTVPDHGDRVDRGAAGYAAAHPPSDIALSCSQALRTIAPGTPSRNFPVRIRELQDVLDVLPDISRHMDELNTRSASSRRNGTSMLTSASGMR